LARLTNATLIRFRTPGTNYEPGVTTFQNAHEANYVQNTVPLVIILFKISLQIGLQPYEKNIEEK